MTKASCGIWYFSRAARPSATGSEQGDQDPAHRCRPGRAQPDVAGDLPAAREQGQSHQDDYDTDTHHGAVADKQKEWKGNIVADLPGYDVK